MNIEPNTRAAFYIQHRAALRNVTAAAAWARANAALNVRARLSLAYDAAAADLATAQAVYDAADDKRKFAPANVALEKTRADVNRARRALSDASAFYIPPRWTSGGCGNWLSVKGHYFAESVSAMFRDVAKAADIGASDILGFYDNPFQESTQDGDGTAWGIAVQIPSKGGRARYVAGYVFGHEADAALLDMGTIYESDAGGEDWEQARKDAARAGHELARVAADDAREYATAWQAGQAWADNLEQESSLRKEALAILSERRALPPAPEGAKVSTLCQVIRDKVESLRAQIQESRDKRAELRAGDDSDFPFYSDKRLRLAFEEGAGL
jgi:hypothetical protein